MLSLKNSKAKLKTMISANYKMPLIIAILLHLVLFFILFVSFVPEHVTHLSMTSAEKKVATPVQASVVFTPSQAEIARQLAEKRAAEQRLVAERLRQEQIRQAAIRAEQLRQAEIARAEQIRQADIARAQQIAREKQIAAERVAAQQRIQQQEKLRAEQIQREKALAAQQALEKRQAEIRQALAEKLAKQRAIAAALAQQRDMTEAEKYAELIKTQIKQNWLQPNLDLQCTVLIRLASSGQVLSATISKSSGNAIFDRSAITAVYKASPLPVPHDAKVFDIIRTLSLTFKPDGS